MSAALFAAVRGKARLVTLIALAALAVASPHLVWRFEEGRTLEVVVVDKTVPFEKYREHAAIPWILHAMKLRGANGGFLAPEADYIGFDPRTKTGRELTPVDLEGADVLVVTDTYGVYEGDYERPGEAASLERSPKIYGGLDDDEARAIEAFAGRGGLVIAEFNTFASPTPPPARERLEGLFGVRWTKWVARYWPDLQDANEVPRWVGRAWQRLTGTPFEMTGGGLVLVREDQDMIVLRDGEDLTRDVVSQEATPRGAVFDLPERGAFRFWMDVLEPVDGEVLYEHVIGATPAGAKKLAEHGLPLRFPALVKRRDAFYFAGDFVDTSLELGDPESAGLLRWKRHTGCRAGADEASFWGFYVPILERLFASRAR